MPDTETKSSPSDADAEAETDVSADAEIEAGRFIPHDKVVEWLKSWGTANELPCPEPEPR
jgi:predicted transcriptional regulator